jgi:sarcosine oxidase subunit alpha
MSERIQTPLRTDAGGGKLIDRSQSLTFKFEGKSYTAHPGDTIASALAASGVDVLSRSFKYHRPRGLLCGSGHCPNCMVQVGQEPNVRACQTTVVDGMEVDAQNSWPSLNTDVMAVNQLIDQFLPAGFYYKTFIRPQFLWPAYEHFLRTAAGLGRVDPETVWDHYDKQYLHGDVAIIGGGPAGMQAALSAADAGADVLLFDENDDLGGHLRYSGSDRDQATGLIEAVQADSKIRVYSDMIVLGMWEENWMSAVQGNRMFKVRTAAIVVATGAYEQPLLFDNNDLPGIMLPGSAQRLIELYGVKPGQRAVVVTANDNGWTVAGQLQQAGVELAAIVDERSAQSVNGAAAAISGDVPVHWRHTIMGAQGKRRVKTALITPIAEDAELAGITERIDCDLIIVSTGFAPANGMMYQAGSQVKYDDDKAEFLTEDLPAGTYAAGRVMGTEGLDAQLNEARLAGQAGAAFCGHGDAPSDADLAAAADTRAAEAARSSDRAQVKGWGKQFLCYCEDVTDKDLKTSIAEGYDSMELLKRYSTISMGPCQGKMCSVNTIHLCARENGWTIDETGTTTARPPMTPVKLGSLAGQNMDPVRYTPIHEWHERKGATMMVAGMWMRPEHYGNPTAEVKAVRERVGVIDVSTLGKLKLTGPGVPELLNKIYVNKWLKLREGRVRYGVMCNDEGVVMDDGVTARLSENEWFTTTTSSGAGTIYEWIQWWAQSGWGEGAHLTNVTEGNAAFNLAGPRSRDVLAKLTDADVSHESFGYMQVKQIDIAGVPSKVLRIGFTGELSYEIHCPSASGLHVWEAILEAGQAFDILPFGVEAQRILRLEKAHIIVGQDTDALSDPISADMAWAVKHDKPNFLGNRPLKRVADQGPEQKLVGFKMITPNMVPEEGLQIVTQKFENGRVCGYNIIGWITSSRMSPTLNETIGLCWLPPELADQVGGTFYIRREGKLLEAAVHHGAFYDPEGTLLQS